MAIKTRNSPTENGIYGSIARCTSCVLPRTAHGLGFDADGRCDLCNWANQLTALEKQEHYSEGNIDEVIANIKLRGKNRRYDCIIGLSGGRDSSYLLHELVHKYNLRVLAAYYRTPFTPDTIDANVKRMVQLLGVKLVRMNISQKGHLKSAKKFALLWKSCPRPELINLMCASCKFTNREVFRIARKYGVKSILLGGSRYESFQFGAIQILKRKHEDSFATQTLKGLKVVRRGLLLLLAHPSIISALPLAAAASLLYLAPHSIYLRMRHPGIIRIHYFRLAEWNEADCIAALSQLGWELPSGCKSYWKADCDMAEMKNIMFQRTMGVTHMDALLSNMVRFGFISRDEALARLEKEGEISYERLKRLTDALGLPADFFNDIR